VGEFVAGDVVVLNFPFSDLRGTKRRPALVLAALEGEDIILCQITSQARMDRYSVALDDSDFTSGGLRQLSRIRPNRLFTAEEAILLYRAGHVSGAKLREALNSLIALFALP
jgi:mRNA interferase MazF